MYARQNFFEGLEKERENKNTGSDSEFSSEEEMEEVNEAAVDLVKTEAIGVEFQQFVAELIGKVKTVVKMFAKVLLRTKFCKSISKRN